MNQIGGDSNYGTQSQAPPTELQKPKTFQGQTTDTQTRYLKMFVPITHIVLQKLSIDSSFNFDHISTEICFICPEDFNFCGKTFVQTYQPPLNQKLYNALGMQNYGPPVVKFFKRFKDNKEAEAQLCLHTYQPKRHILHIGSTEVKKIGDVQLMAHLLEHAFLEFKEQRDQGNISKDCKLYVLPPYLSILNDDAFIWHYISEIVLCGMAVAILRIPEAIFDPLDQTSFKLLVDPSLTIDYNQVLGRMMNNLKIKPFPLDDYYNELSKFDNAWSWIRKDNSPEARFLRLSSFFFTKHIFWAQSFRSPDGNMVPCQYINHMLANTKKFDMHNAITYLREAKNPNFETVVLRIDGRPTGKGDTAMEHAINLIREGYKVAAFNAASAYGCGGGVATGGRHAQEEAWCFTTTCHASLTKMLGEPKGDISWIVNPPNSEKNPSNIPKCTPYREVGPKPQLGPKDKKFQAYIPYKGCVISPKVEILRKSGDFGYKVIKRPMALQALISLAAFNCNPLVNDAPLDAPTSYAEYITALKEKLLVGIVAAMSTGADTLIIPDIGCGVFANDPVVTGKCLQETLLVTYGYFKRIVLLGKKAFVDSAVETSEFARVETLPKLDEDQRPMIMDQDEGYWTQSGDRAKKEDFKGAAARKGAAGGKNTAAKGDKSRKPGGLKCTGCNGQVIDQMVCPTCATYGKVSPFHSQECFERNWKEHSKTHKSLKASKAQ